MLVQQKRTKNNKREHNNSSYDDFHVILHPHLPTVVMNSASFIARFVAARKTTQTRPQTSCELATWSSCLLSCKETSLCHSLIQY